MTLVPRVLRACPAWMDYPAKMALPASQDPRVNQQPSASKVIQVSLELQVYMEHQEIRDLRDFQEWVSQAFRVKRAAKDFQVVQEYLVQQVRKVNQATA